MKAAKAVIALLLLLAFSGCPNPLQQVSQAAQTAKTRAQFNQYHLAYAIYVKEYAKLPEFANTIEFADLLEGKNTKKLVFYVFSEEERNANGEILDAFENVIRIKMDGDEITFISAGPDGIFDGDGEADNILFPEHR